MKKIMKIQSKWFLSMLMATAYSPVAQNQPADPHKPPNQGGANKPQEIISEAVNVDATVQDVNTRKRQVSLKDPDGHTIRLKFSEAAPHIAQLHKGDQVSVSYYRSVAVMLAKPGEEPTGLEQEEYVIAPENGQPGGTVVNSIKTSATVEKVDAKKRQVTLKEPDGRTVKLKVDKRVQNLDQIQPGDQIVVRYTEAAEITPLKPKA